MNISFGPLFFRHDQGSRKYNFWGKEKDFLPIPHCLYLLDPLTSAFMMLNATKKDSFGRGKGNVISPPSYVNVYYYES